MASAPVQLWPKLRPLAPPPCDRAHNLLAFRHGAAKRRGNTGSIDAGKPRDNPSNSVAPTRGLGNTCFSGRAYGAYDGGAGSGLRLPSISDITGGSGRRNATSAADRSSDPGAGAGQAGRPAYIRSGGDDDAGGGQDIGGDRTARQC